MIESGREETGVGEACLDFSCSDIVTDVGGKLEYRMGPEEEHRILFKPGGFDRICAEGFT